MSAKLGIVGLIGIGCVVAAAGGGYWALRSNATDLRPAAQSEPAQPAAPVAAEPPAAAPDTSNVATTPAPTRDVPVRPQPVTKPETRKAITATPSAPQLSPVAADPQPQVTSNATTAATPATTVASAPVPPAPPVSPTPPPPAPRYDEVTVAAQSVLGLRLDSTISTETARVEDRVNARLSRDVLVDGRVAIPAGARLEGTVTAVERGGKFKERPRLGVTFNALVLADGTRMAIQTETIFRDGDSPAGQANTKVGGSAVVGAILGAMIGGKKGALLGGTAGAAGGAAAVAAGDRAEAVLTSGTQLTARLSAPITVLIERNHEG